MTTMMTKHDEPLHTPSIRKPFTGLHPAGEDSSSRFLIDLPKQKSDLVERSSLKACARGHDVDHLHPPPCRESQGTPSACHAQGRSTRGFANPDVSANSGNWASLNSDGPSLAVTHLPSTPCSSQVLSSVQDRSSLQASEFGIGYEYADIDPVFFRAAAAPG